MTALAVFLAAFPAAVLAVRPVLAWLVKKQIVDHPNERSSHSIPTPRGGGLALTPVVLVFWLGLTVFGYCARGELPVIAGAGMLLFLSWRDDRVSLPARIRLAVHTMAVAVGLTLLPVDKLVFQGLLPLWADRCMAAFAWLWFLNLYNFMDGIDGITGVETLCIGGGLALLGWQAPQAAVLAGAALGFLVWNWHPAKIFLGDSGSVPLGYLLGWLLLTLAAEGSWAAALILPAYYLADATITISKRAWKLEPIWQAHRQHFYQRAVQGGASHAQVARLILATDILLAGLALWSRQQPWPALAAAALATAALLLRLRHLGLGKTA